ncbi:hypothetical protein AMTRI_Chr01g137360 [Amborella trichopoda]
MGAPKDVWESILDVTKSSQLKGEAPLLWALHVCKLLNSSAVSLPSVDLAHLLVSHICWSNNVPQAWKFLEEAINSKLVPPIVVLSLLSSRVIPSRCFHPEAYRLYIELLKRHSFSFSSQFNGPHYLKLLKSVDDALHLSQTYGIQAAGLGEVVVEFVFTVVSLLLDAILEDEGLLDLKLDKRFTPTIAQQDIMEIDVESIDGRRRDYCEKLRKLNTSLTIELIGQFLQHRLTSSLLRLACQNMPMHWGGFIQRLQLLESKTSSLRNIAPGTISLLSAYAQRIFDREFKPSQHQATPALIDSGPLISSGHGHGASRSALWIPIDLFLEDAMDGSQVAATCAIEILADLVKSLQAVNGATWHETFLVLWMAALRLVQRERDPIEGPVPRLDARLCILLSITTLAIVDIIEEEEELLNGNVETNSNVLRKEKVVGKRRRDLITCLQMLGDFEGLLAPPQSVVCVANQAAAKAMMFVSGLKVGSGYFDGISVNDMPVNCAGNMRHLIVEACIARNLLDTSVYYWPGYVKGHMNQISHTMPGQMPGWSALMKGAPLTQLMVNALVSTPASSLAELEKISDIAISGSDDDRISAAMILCGVSLIRGWNIQEHAVRLVVRLLSPPAPADYCGNESHLIASGPLLYCVLTGIASVDSVHVFSLHGMVPELAGTLMPICEAFGSCAPSITWRLSTGEQISVHMVFSTAFILLLRLWRFNRPPLEHTALGKGAPVGSQLTPEYLLLVRNSQLASSGKDRNNNPREQFRIRRLSTTGNPPNTQPIFVDSFPKLKIWYRQHQACIASTLSGLVRGTPVHQIVDALLNMVFRKLNKGGNQSITPVTSGSSSISSSSGPGGEDLSQKPMLPAWEILEAVPFVVDAALTACSHGRLSPRELATGLKDIVDFLPASVATMVIYFCSEVTRGVWKPASMNGTDWPSPAANLSTVEAELKKIVGTTGVDVPSPVAGSNSSSTLPLPLAAFVSLTITFKLDKASECFLNLAGPALENLAAGCPWPSMPIVAALWTQKVKRWNDFLTFSASRTVFQQCNNAVSQLLKSCFYATIGPSNAPLSTNGGVGSLLGHGFGSHSPNGLSPVAPGILYLRIYRSIHDIMFVTQEILSLVISSVEDIATNGMDREGMAKLSKAKYGMRYGQLSFGMAMVRVKQAAALGASLLSLSGGSGLVQMLFQETLPTWFLSGEPSVQKKSEGKAGLLMGYALAYFVVLCGAFTWGIDSRSVLMRRKRVIGSHMEFLAGILDGKISVGCDRATSRAYVSAFVGLVVSCVPKWVVEVELETLKRLSRGLRLWNENELALALLERGGFRAMGAAAELIMGYQV